MPSILLPTNLKRKRKPLIYQTRTTFIICEPFLKIIISISIKESIEEWRMKIEILRIELEKCRIGKEKIHFISNSTSVLA